MALKPEISLGVGLATATVVYGIYMQATPSIADIRVAGAQDDNIDSARKAAAWTAAAVVGAISLLAKDATVFVLGGGMIIGLDWWTRHANLVDPLTGRASSMPRQSAPVNGGGDVTMAFAEGVGTY